MDNACGSAGMPRWPIRWGLEAWNKIAGVAPADFNERRIIKQPDLGPVWRNPRSGGESDRCASRGGPDRPSTALKSLPLKSLPLKSLAPEAPLPIVWSPIDAASPVTCIPRCRSPAARRSILGPASRDHHNNYRLAKMRGLRIQASKRWRHIILELSTPHEVYRKETRAN